MEFLTVIIGYGIFEILVEYQILWLFPAY